MTQRQDDLPDIRAALAGDCERLAELLLGVPAVRASRAWRWGGKGSLSLVVSGPKRATWYDHEAGLGGGMLDLIMHARRVPLTEAITWARAWTGHERPAADAEVSARRQQQEETEAQQRARAIGHAQWMAAEGVPIDGTPAETYLTETRGIPRPAQGWPDAVRWYPPASQQRNARWPKALRWHAGSPGLLVIATNDMGETQAVQHIRLTDDGRKVADGKLVKITQGVGQGAAVRLPCITVADAWPYGIPLQLAEGPETGLSAWRATGNPTWITLGSLTRAVPPDGGTVVVCRDDDALPGIIARDLSAARGRGDTINATRLEAKLRGRVNAEAKLAEAIAGWRAAGCQVAVATPWRARRGDSTDMNDAIRADGCAGLASRINRALAKLRQGAEVEGVEHAAA